MVTCLIGFMGGDGNLSPSQTVHGIFHFSLTSPSLTGRDGVGLFYCPRNIFTIALASAMVIPPSMFTSAAVTLKFVMLDGSVDRK